MKRRSKKEQYQLNMDALYGTDMSQDRLINKIVHTKRKKKFNIAIIVVSCLFLALNVYIFSLQRQGYVFAVGQKIDGSRYANLITTTELNDEKEKPVEELTYESLLICDLLTCANFPLLILFIIVMITLIDKRSISVKALRAKAEYDRRTKLLDEENKQQVAQKIEERHKNAPDIYMEDDTDA